MFDADYLMQSSVILFIGLVCLGILMLLVTVIHAIREKIKGKKKRQ
jgi:hypothetical protein